MTSRTCRLAVLFCGAALGALGTGPVLAQDQTATTTGAQPGAEDAGSEAARSGDIVVTAQRREERAQDVPIVVTAFSSERLRQLDISEPQDLYGSVPSLTVGQQGTATRDAQTYSIRGQSTSFLASPAVVQYLNEVPLPAAITVPLQGGAGLFVDLQNVQVLTGPQGTLFGRNTTGGAVLYQAHKPVDRLEGYAEGTIGNYDLRGIEGALNIPIVAEKLLVRVSGAFRDRRGYTRDLVWDKWRDDTHWYSGRIGITFRPTERLENYLMVYGSKSSNNGAGMILRAFNLDGTLNGRRFAAGGLIGRGSCTNGAATAALASCEVYRRQVAIADQIGPRRTRLSLDAYTRIKTWGAINNTTYELSDELTLRNIVSFQKLKLDYGIDSDGSPLQTYQTSQNGAFPDAPIAGFADAFGLPNTPGNMYLNQPAPFDEPRDSLKQFTEELQLQGTALDRNLTFTIGAFYFNSKPDGLWRSRTVQNCPAARTGQLVAGCIASDGFSGVSNESKAVYAQGTLDFATFSPSLANLRFTAGIRQTWDRIKGFASSWNIVDAPNVVVTTPRPTNPIADNDTDLDDISCTFGGRNGFTFLNTTDGRDVCNFGETLKSKATTWTVGLDYKPVSNLLAYGKISRGYKSGGFNPFAIGAETTTFNPEKLTTYEAGIKSDWQIGTMPFRLNATYYYSDYKGLHRPVGNTDGVSFGAAVLAADATIQGFELETSLRPIDAIEIGGTVSHADAEYTRFIVPNSTGGLDCNGIQPAGATLDQTCSPFQYLTPWIYNIHASVDLPVPESWGALSLYANYAHVSSQWTAVRPAEPGAALGAYGLLNASLNWSNAMETGVDLTVFVTNLTDKLYRVSNNNVFGTSLVWSELYGEPRMFGLKLRYSFGN